jgi:DNA-binding CsgD family transcriptional regulator
MGEATAELSSTDLRRALDFAGDLAGCSSREDVDGQVRLLPQLVGTDTIIIGAVRKPAPGSDAPATLDATDDPPGFFDPEARAAFARLWHQQPVVVHHFRGFAPRALKVSDFLADRQWRRSEVYNDCYGQRMGLTWEIAAQIRFTSEEVACAALQRSTRDFTERDRSLLDAITPHLRAGYARTDVAQRGARRLALLERGLEERGDAALLTDMRGGIVAAGKRARAILHDWFGERRERRSLPADLDAWRVSERGSVAPPVLELHRPGRRLRLRLIAGRDEDVILLSERRESPPSAGLLSRRLPISRREAEVLARLAQGRMNAAIAQDLAISPHTVARHVERIYAKLDVHNRAEATAAVLRALDGDPTRGGDTE